MCGPMSIRRAGLSILFAAASLGLIGCATGTQVPNVPTTQFPQALATAWPVVLPSAAVRAGAGSSRSEPIKLSRSGTLNGLGLRVDQVSFDARKVAKNLTARSGDVFVAAKMTVTYPGDGQWGFSGLWSLKVVGHSGVVTPIDSWCQANLPTSHLTDGATVIGVHSLSGWAGCWSVKKTDLAALELLYEPPFLSPYGQPAPMLWFALR